MVRVRGGGGAIDVIDGAIENAIDDPIEDISRALLPTLLTT